MAGSDCQPNARGGRLSYGYDGSGNLQTITDVRQGTTTYGYSGHLLTTLTDANGHVALSQLYDTASPARVVEQSSAASGASVTYSSTGLSDVSKSFTTNALANDSVFAINSAGAITSGTITANTATSVTTTWGNGLPAPGVGYFLATQTSVASGNSTTFDGQSVTDSAATFANNALVGDVVEAGGNAGVIVANTPQQLTVAGGWVGTPPANGTAYRVFAAAAAGGGTICVHYSSGPTHSSAACPLPPMPLAAQATCGTATSSTVVVDARHLATTYYFDSAFRTLQTTDPAGGVTLDCYDSNNDLISETDPNHHTTTHQYDGSGNMLSRTDALSPANTWTFQYTSLNDIAVVTDPDQHQTTYNYTTGNLTSVVVRDLSLQTNQVESFTCLTRNSNGDGEITAIIESTTLADCTGNTTTIGYDTYGDRDRVVDARFASPQTPAATFTYDAAGRLTSATDEKNNTTTYTYDAQNNVTSVTDPRGAGFTTSYGHDAKGNLTSVTDALSHLTQYVPDAADRLAKVIDPAGTTLYGYGPDDNRTAVTDANGHTTHYGYDARDDLAALVEPPTGSSSYTYVPNGQPTVLQLDPTGFTTSYVYDPAQNLSSRTDANGVTTTYQYDFDNRLHETSYSNGQTPVIYDYFGDGTRKDMSDATGTTSYVYDALHRLTSVTFPGAQTVGYQYDAVGNRHILTYPDNKQVTYTYYPDHLLNSVTDWGSRSTTYVYDNAGRLQTASRSNGVASTYSFDAASELTGIAQPDTSASNAASISYGTPDAIGNWPSRTQGVTTDNYTYDALSRLTGVQYGEGDCQSYGYDAAGNRSVLVAQTSGTCPTNPAPNVTSDAANRLMSEGGVTHTFDADGRQVGAGVDQYRYDDEGRLTSVLQQPRNPGGGVSCDDIDGNGTVNILDLGAQASAYNAIRGGARYSFAADLDGNGKVNILDLSAEAAHYNQLCASSQSSFAYNGDGLRTSKTENGATTSYVWDVASSLPVALQDSGGNTYEYGLGLVLQDTNGTPAWTLQDGLGSTVATANNGGAITSTYRYDAYGAVRSTTGTPAPTFTFDGEQADASGLVYLRARYMDPATGRFVTQDPFANVGSTTQTLDRYTYVLDDPSQLSDPYGLWPCPGCGKIKRLVSAASHGLQRAVTSLNCYSAAVSVVGVAIILADPAFAPVVDAGLFLAVEGPAFALSSANDASQFNRKEGWSFNNVSDVIGGGTNLLAYNAAALRIGLRSGLVSDLAGYAAIPAAAVSISQCAQDVRG